MTLLLRNILSVYMILCYHGSCLNKVKSFGLFFPRHQFIPQGLCWFNKLVNPQLQTDNKALCATISLCSQPLWHSVSLCVKAAWGMTVGWNRFEQKRGEEKWEEGEIDSECDLEALICSLLHTIFFFPSIPSLPILPAEKTLKGSSASPTMSVMLRWTENVNPKSNACNTK